MSKFEGKAAWEQREKKLLGSFLKEHVMRAGGAGREKKVQEWGEGGGDSRKRKKKKGSTSRLQSPVCLQEIQEKRKGDSESYTQTQVVA